MLRAVSHTFKTVCLQKPRVLTLLKRHWPHSKSEYSRTTLLVRSNTVNSVPLAMGVRVLEDVVKSPNDKRNYRAIQLENGIRVLLISDEANILQNDGDVGDKSEKLSAAALCVGVGSFSDPLDVPGMAHFLEHMVFMGSTKYPDENDFDAFVKKYGGGTNAFTDCERTVFYFDVKRNHMRDALDRFAQFFISPLMKKDSVDREVKAVDSEFDMALQSDTNRKERLRSHMARDGHPMGFFMWGNKDSIQDTPGKSGIDVYERLQEFHKTFYSSHYMTLVVQSRHDLDTLQDWSSDIFSAVPNNNQIQPVFDKLESPFDTPGFYKLYKAVPVKRIHQIELCWSLPSLLKDYRKKPLHYLGWLVGHEGAGSILAYLRKKVWALSLCGGNSDSGFEHNTSGALFSISVTLTEQGMDHVLEVITVVLQYLAMLRKIGPQKRIFDEIKTIEDNDFAWQEQLEPSDTVEKQVENLQLYPPADCLTGETLMWEYDEQLIADCQNRLTPDTANILLYSKRFAEDGVCDLQEPWFNIPYSCCDVPEHWLKSWKDLKPNPDLHLPAENTYIATDFALKEPDREATMHPTKIIESPSSTLWYKKDTKFKVPKGYMYFKLSNSIVTDSALNAATLDMFIRTLEHNLTEVTYAANCAQLTYHLSTDSTGVRMKFSGYNHKLKSLFCKVIDHIADFSCGEDVFEALIDQQKRIYYNRYIKPEKMSQELRLSLLLDPYWSTVEKAQALGDVTRQGLIEFAEKLRSQAIVEGLVQGNITSEEALEVEKYLVDTLKCQPSAEDQLRLPRVRGLEAGEVLCRVENFNKADVNSVITNYYQHGPADLYQYSLNELLVTRMEEPCFDYLRTREQLGYTVFCTCRNTDGILGLSVTVCSQAHKFMAAQVDEKIEEFFLDFKGTLEGMTDEDFNTLVTSLITLKCCEDTQMIEEVDRNWDEICSREYAFDRLPRQVEALRKMTLSELKEWFVQHVPVGGQHRKLSVQIVGNADAAKVKQKSKSGEEVEDDEADDDSDSMEDEEEEIGEEDEDDEDSEYSDDEGMSGDNSDDAECDTGDVAWNFLPNEDNKKAIIDLDKAKNSLELYPYSRII